MAEGNLQIKFVVADDMSVYLRGTVNYTGADIANADKVQLGELVRRIDHKDGDVTIVYLCRSPLQPGQEPWVGA